MYIYILMFILLSGLRTVGRAILGRAIHVDLSGNQFLSRCFDSGSDEESKSRESRDSWQQMVSMTWKIYSNLSLLKWSKMVFWVSLQSRCATAIWSLTSRLPKHRRTELGPSSCGDPPALWDPGRARDLGSLCLQHLLKDLEKIHWNMVETCGNWSASRKYQINNHTTVLYDSIHSPDIGFFVPTSNKPQSRHIPTHQCPHLHHCVARVDLLAENHPSLQ